MKISLTNHYSSLTKPAPSNQPITVLQSHVAEPLDTQPENTQGVFLSELDKLYFNFNKWLEEPIQSEFSAEKIEKLKDLYSKMSEEDFIRLGRLGITSNDDFLSMVETLDKEQLSQLTDTFYGLSASANMLFTHVNEFNPSRTYEEKVEQFIEVLSDTQRIARDQLIEKAAEYNEKISIHKAERKNDATYESLGGYFDVKSSANDLQNFVSTVIDTKSPADFVNKLDQYSREQQSSLLNVLGMSRIEGEQLLDGLLDKSDEARTSILSFIGKVALKTNPFFEMSAFGDSEHVVSISKGFGDNLFETTKKMLENMGELLTTYNFSDEQLVEMGDQLNDLNRKEQIGYLEAAVIGLDNLLGIQTSSTNELIDMKAEPQAMNKLQSVLSNKDALQAVYEVREGEDRRSGRSYVPKTKWEYLEDLEKVVSSYIPPAESDENVRDPWEYASGAKA